MSNKIYLLTAEEFDPHDDCQSNAIIEEVYFDNYVDFPTDTCNFKRKIKLYL